MPYKLKSILGIMYVKKRKEIQDAKEELAFEHPNAKIKITRISWKQYAERKIY